MAAATEEPDSSDSASELEEADIEAVARAGLGPGEVILGEGQDPSDEQKQEAKRGICLRPLIDQKGKELEYKVPEGAKRVPWVDTLVIEGQTGMPKGVGAKDGVKLESTFLGFAHEAVKEGFRRLKVMKIPFTRPADFYAEMLKTDKQMFKIRQMASEEQRRIKVVEDRRKAQAAKKFAKSAKSKKLEMRAEEKRQNLDDIAKWRKKTMDGKDGEAGDKDLQDILDKKKDLKQRKGIPEKSKKRQAADSKYGFGGKKRFKKSNDKSSTDDFSFSPWAKEKGKGKGKGRGGGGGKGKGKGRGGGGGTAGGKKRRKK